MTTLYLDMDGVVADFDEYAFRMLGVPPSEGIYPDHIWVQLASNSRIYRDLKIIEGSIEFVNECSSIAKNYGLDLLFLTAVPKANDVKWSFYDKVKWAESYFPGIPVHFGPYSKDKYHHCTPGDILIDDRLSNIEEWCASGGISIHHQNHIDSIDKLKLLFSNSSARFVAGIYFPL